jgi:hypothetical protein
MVSCNSPLGAVHSLEPLRELTALTRPDVLHDRGISSLAPLSGLSGSPQHLGLSELDSLSSLEPLSAAR